MGNLFFFSTKKVILDLKRIFIFYFPFDQNGSDFEKNDRNRLWIKKALKSNLLVAFIIYIEY